MLVTINTDASFNPDLRIGAFAFWMVCNNNRLFGAGVLKGIIQNSQEAEFKAVLNALHYLKDKSQWSGITKAIINTDCMDVVHCVNGTRKPSKWAIEVQKHFTKVRADLRIHIEARHVKSHSGTDEKRKYVNDWCDRKAKWALQSLINQSK